ncbi:hypothetical protein JCM11641_000729 [Rhodosporidiobolus odoratus]
MRSSLSFLLALLATLGPNSVNANRDSRHAGRAVGQVITTQTGTYQGKVLSKVEQWLGVPYAQSPVGDLRLRRPQALPIVSPDDAGYGAVENATTFYPRCIQASSTKAVSEDCLRVNIYRPQSTATTAGLPVMVYIFGGSFYSGGANSYSPTNLVLRSKAINRPVILITLDYRLGFLGFGASAALREAGSLNLGLHDQRQALRWIHDNIANFGGDPSKILLFGQSAGAIAVSYQMMAYGGNVTELIRGAIMESGAPGTAFAFDHTSSFPAYNYLGEDEKNTRVLEKTGCNAANDELACLRNATTREILSGQGDVRTNGGFPYAPVIDGEFLTDVPSKLLPQGRFAQIPFISGSQLDEASKAFTSLNITLDSEMQSWLQAQTPGMTEAQASIFLLFYPTQQAAGSPYNTGEVEFLWKQFKRASSIFGDLGFEAPRRAFLAAANALDDRNQGAAGATTTISSPNATSAFMASMVVATPSSTASSSSASSSSQSRSSSRSTITFTTTTTPVAQATQTCAASSDCSNTIPSNANRYVPTSRFGRSGLDLPVREQILQRGSMLFPYVASKPLPPLALLPVLTYFAPGKGCRTGYTLTNGSACAPSVTAATQVPTSISSSSSSSVPRSTTSSLRSTTTSVATTRATTIATTAAAAQQTCSVSGDCTNTVPKNANRFCNKGVCAFRCRSGYVASGTSSCVASGTLRRRDVSTSPDAPSSFDSFSRSSTTPSTAALPTSSTTTVSATSPVAYTPLRVWSYQFSQKPVNGENYLGAAHGDEIPWVYANAATTTDEQVALKNAMSDSWIYFANDLNPNGPTSVTYWPQYLQANFTQIQFQFGLTQNLIADTYRQQAISYINDNPDIFEQ